MKEFKKVKKNITVFFSRIFKNRNIFIFLFFFVISSFLWFLNALNKEYSTVIKIPYKIENVPENLRPEKNVVPELQLKIYGHGYSILKQKIESVKLPAIIDFNNKQNPFFLHKDINSSNIYILTSDVIPIISKRFGDNLLITGISPDTIFFNLYDNSSKTVPIIPRIEYKVHPEFIINGKYSLNEDSVTIYGHKDILDTITGIRTQLTDLGILGEKHIKSLELEQLHYLDYSIEKVIIDIPVEKYTESYKEVEIRTMNFPEDFDYILIPEKVNIYYKTPLSMYNVIDENNFEAYVNYDKKKNDVIEIEVNSINPYIEIIRIAPISITYFLEKKAKND